MKRPGPGSSAEPDGEIDRLVQQLRDTEARLYELTGGELASTQMAILDALPAKVALLDGRGIIQAVNAAWRHTDDGSTPIHAIGQDYLAICDYALGDNDASEAAIGIRSVLAGTTAQFSHEYPCHTPTEERWFQMVVTPLNGLAHEGAVVMHQDVTDRYRAEQAQRQSHERFMLVSQATADAIWDLDLATNALWWSDGFQSLFGFAAEDVGPDLAFWARHVHPDDQTRVVQGMHAAIGRGARHWSAEYRFRRKDGSYAEVLDRGHVIHDAQGQPVRMVGGVTDLSERKAAEADMARLNRALRMLSTANASLIHIVDEAALLHAICTLAVDVGYRMAWVGYAHDDPGRTITPMCHAGFEDGFLSKVNPTWSADSPTGGGPVGRSIRQGTPIISNDISHDGTVMWRAACACHGYHGIISLPLRDGQRTFGVLALYLGEIRPITDEEVELLQELADNLAFGITNLRSQSERQRIQSAMLQVASGVWASTGSAFFEQLAASMAKAVDAAGGVVTRLLPGRPRARSVAAIIDGRPVAPFEFAIDTAPWDALEKAGDKVVTLKPGPTQGGPIPADSTVVGLSLTGTSGRALGQIFVVFSQSQPHGLVAPVLQIFAARAAAELERLEADSNLREQASLIDKAHDAIIVYGTDYKVRFWNASAERLYGWSREEAIGQLIETLIYPDTKRFDGIASALLENGEWRGQVDHRRRDGTHLTVEGNWTLVRDEQGQPDAILSIATDITHQLALEEQLGRAQRLDSIGQLTGGVAHDFNNLLTVILGNAELLSEELADNPDLAEMASMTVEAAQQGAELTHRLLAFARRQTLAPRSVNVNQLVGRMDPLLRRTLSEAIDIRFELDEALWDALVDPSQLEGALLNLCINARDAMPDGGRLTIRTANIEFGAAQIAAIPDLTPGCYIAIEVVDSGQGIPPQHLSRVFDPFFTTKGVGKGTGLGLSMVYGFVKQSLGHIAIESETGRGTTIRMLLPRTEEASALVSEAAIGAADYRGTETILLVEDNALVRHHCHSQLAELGYTVIAVADGPEALRALADHDDIDLLFTDVIMPGGMTGRDVADAARARRPGLRVLFTSGYSEDALTKQGRLEAGTHLLAKPYRRVDLARKVRSVLDERDT